VDAPPAVGGVVIAGGRGRSGGSDFSPAGGLDRLDSGGFSGARIFARTSRVLLRRLIHATHIRASAIREYNPAVTGLKIIAMALARTSRRRSPGAGWSVAA